MLKFSRRTFAATAIGATLFMAPSLASAEDFPVTIQGFAYSTASLSVSVGDRIIFTNLDGAPHTATARDGSFDTGRLGNGESDIITITSAGTFEYFCRFHPSMSAQVTAQ